MGGIEPAGTHVLELLAAQARRHGQQAARRATRRGAVRGRSHSRRSAPLRGERAPRSRSSRCSARRSSSRTSTASSGSSTGPRTSSSRRWRGAPRSTRRSPRRSGRLRGGGPTDDLSGADAAAKMAILATIAFGSRVALDDVEYQGLEEPPPGLPAAARELEMVVRLVGAATLIDDEVDAGPPRARRPSPSACRDRGGVQRGHAPGRRHPRDHARGAGRGVGDGLRCRRGHGQHHRNDRHRLPAQRSVLATLQRMPPGNLRSPFYVHLEVDDQPGVLADVSQRLARTTSPSRG